MLLQPVHISDSVRTQSLAQPLRYKQEERLSDTENIAHDTLKENEFVGRVQWKKHLDSLYSAKKLQRVIHC